MTALLIIGWGFFVGGTTYAAWCGMRVWLLRQRLFDVRDKLWFAAREAGAFDDVAYREARETINTMIRCAPLISLNMLSDLTQVGSTGYNRPKTSVKAMVIAIDQAYHDFGTAIGRYVLFMTAHGWFQVAMHVLTGRRLDINQLLKKTSKQASRAYSAPEVRQAEWDDHQTPHLVC